MAVPNPRPRGPRGADADTREDIKAAALELFAAHGYEGASLRAIAREAGVDPALVRHYFESKSELFVASMGPLDQIVSRTQFILAGERDTVGERIVRAFLAVWGSDEYGPRLKAILRTAVTNPEIATVAKRMILEQLFLVVARGVPDAGVPEVDRAAATASQMIGLGVTRYILGLEPVASMTDDEVVAQFAPAVQKAMAPTAT